MFITEEIYDEKIDESMRPVVIKYTANFACLVKKNDKVYTIAYDYNEKWDNLLPFYDDKYEQTKKHKFKAKTYGELITEADEITSEVTTLATNSEKEAFNNANKCFFEVFPNIRHVTLRQMPRVIYELKFSKSRNCYTLYKLLYFAVTEVDNVNELLTPQFNIKAILMDINKLNAPKRNKRLVKNVEKIITDNNFPIMNNIIELDDKHNDE